VVRIHLLLIFCLCKEGWMGTVLSSAQTTPPRAVVGRGARAGVTPHVPLSLLPKCLGVPTCVRTR
jgi:hypothetical protein